MGSGDTINGAVRVLRIDTEGNRVNIFNSFEQDRVDYLNNSVSAEEKLFLNTSLSDRYSKPAGAEARTNASAVYNPGEELVIAHKADSSGVSIDVDESGAYAINVVQEDLNRNRFFTPTLRTPDNEIGSDPSVSTSEFVEFFKFTVPDRQRLRLAGSFQAVATEV